MGFLKWIGSWVLEWLFKKGYRLLMNWLDEKKRQNQERLKREELKKKLIEAKSKDEKKKVVSDIVRNLDD